MIACDIGIAWRARHRRDRRAGPRPRAHRLPAGIATHQAACPRCAVDSLSGLATLRRHPESVSANDTSFGGLPTLRLPRSIGTRAQRSDGRPHSDRQRGGWGRRPALLICAAVRRLPLPGRPSAVRRSADAATCRIRRVSTWWPTSERPSPALVAAIPRRREANCSAQIAREIEKPGGVS
jgi:hypothetical protein